MENPVIALFLALAIIIFASRIAGTVARQLGQPRVLGELIVGVVLGPTFLNFLHRGVLEGAHLEETIKELAELGVLILMFIVGLEVHLEELAKVGLVAIFAGVMGAIAPVLLAAPMLLAANYSWEPALFAGVTLAATSVSISAQVLLELGFLRTKEGSALLATALIDDVLAILLVSLTIAITGSEGGTDAGALLSIVGRMAVYLGGAGLIAWFILPRIMDWIASFPHLSQSYGLPAFALVVMLFYGWSAEELGGVAAITGTFLAGLGLSNTRDYVNNEIEESMSYIAYAFLVPVFFVNVGLQTDLGNFPLNALPFALALLVVAVISKIGGAGLGAILGGFDRRESLRVGVCMISRGEVGLIIASLGISTGIFETDDKLFASLFLVILLTTVMTPPLVRLVFQQKDNLSETQRAQGSA